MKNFLLFVFGFLVVAFVLLMGEVGKERKEQPDYQAYSRRINLEENTMTSSRMKKAWSAGWPVLVHGLILGACIMLFLYQLGEGKWN